jgi:hypothetical protein
MAIKIESKAAYIGTVMKALTDFKNALPLVWNLREKAANLVEGGVGCSPRRRNDPGVRDPYHQHCLQGNALTHSSSSLILSRSSSLLSSSSTGNEIR